MAKKDFMNLMKEKTTDLKPSLLSAEEAIKSQIVVLDSLRNLIPLPTDEELVQLEQNILKHGIKDPLTIWETNTSTAGLGDGDTSVYVLVDGHNRFRFSQQHQLDFRINLVRFASLNEIKDYMIDYQLGRRNLTPEQVSYLRGMRYLQQKATRGSNLVAGALQVNVSETLAKVYGVSSRTIKRDGEFAAGLEKLTPELRKKILAGQEHLSKSAVSEIARTDTVSPIPSIDDVLKKSSAQDSKSGQQESAEQIKVLQTEIRKLANGNLDRRTCTNLIKKINALLSLHPSK